MSASYDTTEWSQFLPEVLPHCQDAPETIAINAIRNATIQLLEESHWLITTAPCLTGAANIATYPVLLEPDTEIVRIQQGFYDNMPLYPKSDDELRAMYPTFDWRAISGNPRWLLRDPDDSSSILLVPCPQVTESMALSVVCAIRPTRTAAGVATSVYEKWLEEIAHGAIARLMTMPGQSFTNKQLALYHSAMFRSGIGSAKIDRNRNLERTSRVMRPPRFF